MEDLQSRLKQVRDSRSSLAADKARQTNAHAKAASALADVTHAQEALQAAQDAHAAAIADAAAVDADLAKKIADHKAMKDGFLQALDSTLSV